MSGGKWIVHPVVGWQFLGGLLCSVLLMCLGVSLLGNEAASPPSSKPAAESTDKEKTPLPSPHEWRDLFDGKSLKGWKAPKFGGEGEVRIQDGCIVMERGDPMTGIAWEGEFPKSNYEVEFVAKRTDGIDFFATVTFPVGDSFCSFVTGGWGGSVIGLSSINFNDASDNETTQFMVFKDHQWYKFRLRVTKAKIEVWVDDKKVVDFVIGDHRISTRYEVDLCKPFGFSSWCSTGVIRSIRLRTLTPEEVKAIEEEAERTRL
ncbi:MAG: 3-keto-disaccharide hydrolase [Thermogutta sp.]